MPCYVNSYDKVPCTAKDMQTCKVWRGLRKIRFLSFFQEWCKQESNKRWQVTEWPIPPNCWTRKPTPTFIQTFGRMLKSFAWKIRQGPGETIFQWQRRVLRSHILPAGGPWSLWCVVAEARLRLDWLWLLTALHGQWPYALVAYETPTWVLEVSCITALRKLSFESWFPMLVD